MDNLRVLAFFTILLLTFGLFAPQSYSADVGSEANNLTLPLLENSVAGEKVSLNDYKGKLVYLDFWASWCGPCRESLPMLNEIRNNYQSIGFEVVAINVDENLNDALKFLEKYPVDYPILLDPTGIAPKTYQIMGMPTAYLIDGNGEIIYKHTGFKSKDREKIEAIVSEYLLNNMASN